MSPWEHLPPVHSRPILRLQCGQPCRPGAHPHLSFPSDPTLGLPWAQSPCPPPRCHFTVLRVLSGLLWLLGEVTSLGSAVESQPGTVWPGTSGLPESCCEIPVARPCPGCLPAVFQGDTGFAVTKAAQEGWAPGCFSLGIVPVTAFREELAGPSGVGGVS